MTKLLKLFVLAVGSLCVASAEIIDLLESECVSGGEGNCEARHQTNDGVQESDERKVIPQEEKACSGADPSFCLEDHGWKIQDYLSPHVMEPATIAEIRENLINEKVVVIRNAFIPQFAEAMHHELNDLNFTLQERYDADGFHVKQYNVYLRSDYTEFMLAADEIFMSDETAAFISDITGRDCSGDTLTTASWFAPTGYVSPHSDHREARTVSYVWHLSKNWLPEWGGALYWSQEETEHAYVHASFNTLTIFGVHPNTIHMVTPVSPHATEKRLTWNGWMTSSWNPSPDDDLESLLDTPEKRRYLTENQVVALYELLHTDGLEPDVKERVGRLMDMRSYENFRPAKLVYPVEKPMEDRE